MAVERAKEIDRGSCLMDSLAGCAGRLRRFRFEQGNRYICWREDGLILWAPRAMRFSLTLTIPHAQGKLKGARDGQLDRVHQIMQLPSNSFTSRAGAISFQTQTWPHTLQNFRCRQLNESTQSPSQKQNRQFSCVGMSDSDSGMPYEMTKIEKRVHSPTSGSEEGIKRMEQIFPLLSFCGASARIPDCRSLLQDNT